MASSSLGLIETRSFPVIVRIADAMLKSSGVSLVGFEKTHGGYCTAVVRGGIADVRIAIEAGSRLGEEFGQLISSLVIPRPMANLEAVLPISNRLSEWAQRHGYNRASRQAVGLLETRGFPALVGAADEMLKTGEVELVAYETIGDGLCTAIVRGSVANVTISIEAGMYKAEQIGELNAVAIIPRPLDDLEQALPVASCFIVEAVQMPVALQEQQTTEVQQNGLAGEPERIPFFVEESQPQEHSQT
ncbi:MAG: BMC domain-containing protein [Synechococcaceae cyanobacterium SM2_3_1]|nr:BMC domain-containing protein [Synechococcaceae cyanobacterium SM2_3_1]